MARRIALFGVMAVAAIGTAWALLPEAFPPLQPRRLPDAAALRAPAPPPPVLAPAPLARPEPPRFDVARVGSRGMLVTAGRAAPGAEVTLLEGGRELGRARADGRGEWVILPAEPLPPGARELALLARLPGGEAVGGPDTVLLVVPDPAPAESAWPRPAGDGGQAPSGPIAVLLPPTGAAAAPRVLQAPAPAGPARDAQARTRLGLDLVDYDDTGEMRFAGSAPPGATVRLYAAGRHLGDAVADEAGRWQMTPAEQPGIGRHTLRVDQLAPTGGVAARIEVPFQRERLPHVLLRDGRVVVQPGNNLWRIARSIYGRGVRYTVIYEANRDQIRDPQWIYPGQIFALPEPPG